MSFKVDFSEPIPELISRLVREHTELRPVLDQIAKATIANPKDGLKLLEGVRTNILRHAVEEEARIMRVIMEDAKSESAESVKIMQEHRWVSEFLERRMNMLPELQIDLAEREIMEFIINLKQHFMEEENIVFPLVAEVISRRKPDVVP